MEMNDDPNGRIRRWIALEDAGRDDDADAACSALFQAHVQAPAVRADFVRRTIAAVAEARVREQRRAERLRMGVLVGGSLAAVLGLFFGWQLLTAGMSSALVWGVDLLIGATVQMAGGIGTGVDVWGALAGAGRAAYAFAADPSVTVGLLVLQGIAVAALFALQRLLGSDGEAFK